jgi:hypothetical protein
MKACVIGCALVLGLVSFAFAIGEAPYGEMNKADLQGIRGGLGCSSQVNFGGAPNGCNTCLSTGVMYTYYYNGWPYTFLGYYRCAINQSDESCCQGPLFKDFCSHAATACNGGVNIFFDSNCQSQYGAGGGTCSSTYEMVTIVIYNGIHDCPSLTGYSYY